MSSLWSHLVHADTVYSLARALILAVLVSSEALLAKRKRVGFEQHLILFSASALLAAAQVYVIIVAWFARGEEAVLPAGVWVWYPILSAVGLLGIAFCFDFTSSRDDADIRTHSRRYLLIAGTLFVLGALLTGLPFNRAAEYPTSFAQLGGISVVLHGAQALAFLLLAWKVGSTAGIWLTIVEGRLFLFGCLSGFIGAFVQIARGPGEPFTTVAYTIFVGVALRNNYRRSEIGAVRVSEDRSTKMLLFHRITTQLKSSFDLPRLYEILMDSLMGNLGAESGAIYLRKGLKGDLRPEFIRGPFPPAKPLPDWCPDDLKVIAGVVNQAGISLSEGIVGKVAETGRPVYIYSRADVERHYTWPTGHIKVRTAIALPLRSPEGIYGVVQLVNRIGGGAFSEGDLRFMSLLVEQAGLAIYNARLHAERLERQRAQEQMKIARDIQLHLIPTRLPEIAGLSIGAEYNAAQEVGGDYYDLYRIDHDTLGLIVFDVAGKGVPGALLMAITATFLKMAAPRSQSPAWVLNEVNAALSAGMVHRGLYVTALYAVLKLSTLELTFCSAGHPDAVVIRDGDLTCEKYKPRGAALGLLRPNRFRAALEQKVIKLKPGDTILLYTDGVLEARNAEGAEFGEGCLCDVAREFARQGPRKLAHEIVAAVGRHAGDEPQYDDTTVLAVRMMPDADAGGQDTQ